MDAVQRLELIRARVKTGSSGLSTRPAGLFRASHPDLPKAKVRKPYVWQPPRPARSFGNQIEPDLANAHQPKWVRVADETDMATCAIRRTAKVSPLTKIAQAWEHQETFRPP